MQSREDYLKSRLRLTFLLIMRGVHEGDERNAERAKKLDHIIAELKAMGVEKPWDTAIFSSEDVERMNYWRGFGEYNRSENNG